MFEFAATQMDQDVLQARIYQGAFHILWFAVGAVAITVLTLLFISIPNNPDQDRTDSSSPIWQTLTLGFRYIFNQPTLRAMVIVLSSFAFLDHIGETIYQPMILARTGGDAQLLGTVVATAGVGGLIGGSMLTISGGFQNPRRSLFIGMLSVGLGKLIFGLGQGSAVWTSARLGTSISEPIIFGTYTACWYAIVPAKLQGRAFAADHLIGLLIGAAASLVAGPLTDYIFEPVVQTFALGSAGAGMALLYVLTAIGLLLVGVIGRTRLPPLRYLDKTDK